MSKRYNIKELRLLLGKYNSQKKYFEYIKTLKKIIKLFPHSYDADLALYELGIYFQTKENNYNEAVKWFNKAAKSEFEDICALAKLSIGMCYFRNRYKKKAEEIFSEVISKYPLSSEAETAKTMLDMVTR